MATSAINVKVGVTGSVLIADLGTVLPTAATTTLAGGFVELGYITDAGVVEGMNTSTTLIKAWQNADVVRQIQTEHDLTYKFACLETNAAVLEAYYGNYAVGAVEINGIQPVHASFVLNVIDGTDVIRVVIPYGQVTDRGDITYVNGDAVNYEMTVTAYPDPNYAGSQAAPAKAYKYLYEVGGGLS